MKSFYLSCQRNVGALLLGIFLLVQQTTLSAQTLINPAQEGGFQVGTTFASNGWTVANGARNTRWFVGTAATGFTDRSAYISNNGGANNQYTNDSASVVHFYRDVTFPAGVSTFTLSFNWKADGETSSFDAIIVSLAPTSYTPTASSVSLGTGVLPAPANMLGGMSAPQLWNAASVQTATYTMKSADIGNCSGPVTRRLIFTWKNDASLGDNPPGAIDNISLVGNPMTINRPADRCTDGADIVYNATPVPVAGEMGNFSIIQNTPAFVDNANGTANWDVSNTLPAPYEVIYTFVDAAGCIFRIRDSVTILRAPVAQLKDQIFDCVNPGDVISLKLLYDENVSNTPGGTWSVAPGGIFTAGDSTITVPASGGCYSVTYSMPPNPNGCGGTYTSTADLLIVTDPQPAFTMGGSPSNSIIRCTGMDVSYDMVRTSTGANVVFTRDGAAAAFGNQVLTAPAPGQSITYDFCLTETNNTPAACGSFPGGGYQNCTSTLCKSITLYNDGVCGTGMQAFDSECPPGSSGRDVCAIESSPFIQVGCSFISISIPLKIVEAELDGPAIALCSDESVQVESRGYGGLADIPGFNTVLGTLDGASSICAVATWCLDYGIGSWCPFGWLNPGDWCNKTLAQWISDGIASLLGSDGTGGQVVADTDGDGAFDVIVREYNTFPEQSTTTSDVPNNVDIPGGSITVRHVVGWPYKAESVCGNATINSLNLLDLLSPFIDLIPVAGPIINGVIAGLGCDIPLVFTDHKDIAIPIINTTPPNFLNCPPNGYVFTEDLSCQTAANWSIPLAEDACFGGSLDYQGRTAGTDDADFPGTPDPTVAITTAGVYQTAGPIPGSILATSPGMYTVTYTAYNCNSIPSTCTFPVTVTAGQPILACPNDMVVYTDVDVCEAVVTGLSPTSGVGCATVINFSVDYPAVPGFADFATNTAYSPANRGIHNDVSGTTFPQGTTTVTYTMLVDLNGDGDATDPGESTTCTFDVTVVDNQRPTAVCIDQEVQLDVTGVATVYATSLGGSPFMDGGSTDNCDPAPVTLIQKPGGVYAASLVYDCTEVGNNFINLQVTDAAGNISNCIARLNVIDFLNGVNLTLAPPELCLEANNPSQFDFSNYLNITLENGQSITHAEAPAFLGGTRGYFGITAFSNPGSGTPGTISLDGVYTPGTGTGFVTVSYILIPGNIPPPQGNNTYNGCYKIEHATFELRQPLDMASPECECVQENERIVDLGVVSGGLEPYTIQYSGGRLDVNSDDIFDDNDGEYTYDVANGHNIDDFQQDLGELRIVYTQPVWSFKILDARGCEIFRSGSCDNDDLLVGPTMTCPPSNNTLTTEEFVCESQYTWTHPVPTDNCAVTLFDFRIANPDGSIHGPDNLNALLYPPPAGNPPYPPSFFQATYDFELGVSIITYYAEDAQGNFTTCSFQITVSDDDPPRFINCPYPPVVQNAESMHCDAYVTFSLPLAVDNCDFQPVVTQIDNTGLSTGSRFPVGTTIMYWEARDFSDNRDTCQVKVIVNDYWQDPILTCPANVNQDNDPWLCGAVVNNIAPVVDGPCKNNYGVVYEVFEDAALTIRKECGVSDASGIFFDEGDSWVRYTVQNQPLLLITEVTQSGAVDRLEISNLGPADIDISCLEIRRVSSNPAADETLGPVTLLPALDPSILLVGTTRVFDFTFDGAGNMPACYTISYMGTIFDQVATNGYVGCSGFTGTLASGDVIRHCEADTDSANDWKVAENCGPLTIGAINPDLDVMPDNGTLTSLQSILPNKVNCVFKVNIKDAEDPFCGRLTTNTVYAGPAIPNISAATCNRSTITIPASNCIIGDIIFNLTGTATPQNSTITLISPKGIKVVITQLPNDSIASLFAQKAEGLWTLDIVPNAGQTPTVTGWSLTINCIAPFDLPNQVLPNDPGECGADFTWIHPYFLDNCFEGTITVAYTSNDAACVPPGGPLLGTFVKGGYSNTQFFCVGTTLVTYTLTDASGNVATCGFSVTVNDVEDPVLTCPQQIFVNLNGGECGAFVNYAPAFAGDNCGVVDTIMTPPSGSWFTIGDHQVVIVIFDAAGNSVTCTFTVSVIEYVPTDFNLICNDLSHVSIDSSCVFVLNADGALEGNNYHCYDDYIITVKNQQNQNVPNTFGSADIGKTFTVTVLDPETGNTCWSLLKIEDKLVPGLTCPADLTIACSESTDVSNTGDVVITDCSATTRVVDDEFLDFGQCNSPRGQIVRTWIVTDAWANQSACSQTITITPFDLQDVVFPIDLTVDCESVYLNNNATAPDATGRPSINGFPIGGGGLCTASISYSDERFDICPGSYEILRTWKVRNTCFPVAPDNPISHVQVITVSDFNGPQFVCPPAVTVTTNPFECCATAALPSMIVSEGCSGIIDLEAKVTGVHPTNGNVITFTVGGSLSDFPGNNWWNPDTLAVFNYTQCLPLGNYDVRYKASDNCGNTSYCNFVLTVADLIPPSVACDQTTQVALTDNGEAVVNATTFDDGTTDNCCLDFFEVRRMDQNNCSGTQFGPTVRFCCSDIGDTVMVVFRAWDCHGNSNDCMVSVLVEDKIRPACLPPAQVNVNCENFDPSLWAYGKAEVSDNCCLDTNRVYQGQIGLTHTVNYALFDTVCNKGTITRTFRSFDCAGNSSQCTQRVIVTYEQDYFVRFPNDVIVTQCDGTGVYGEPTFFGEDCELLAVSFTDEIFTVVPDACFKIERTWKIINWCTFVPNLPIIQVPNPNPNPISNNPANLPGPIVSPLGTLAPWAPTSVRINPTDPQPTNYSTFYDKNANGYEYKQIIKIIDGQAPTGTFVVPDCSNQNWLTPNNGELWNEMYWWDNGIQTHDLCEEPTDLCITATDACSGSNVNIEYLLFLDLDGDGVMETVVNSVNTGIAGLGWNNVLYNNLNTPNFSGGTSRQFDERPVPGNQKYGFSIQETVNGTEKTACVRWNTQQQQNNHVVPELPHGTHKIKWFVTDGCGNNAEYEYTFTVKDCKAPTVVCINGLSTNIMPTGMITLWASDFLQYTEDNCTPAGQIKIGIRKCGTGTGFPVDANGNPITNVTFDCTELGQQCVELWAIDAAGNADYCETYLIVQDNLGGCQPGNSIIVSGALKTETQDGVEEAVVNIIGTAPAPFSLITLTDPQGLYNFNSVPMASTFTIAPEKDDNPLNGVTTYDLVLISKHILGLEPLNSPYKMIAADANKSGSITTFDIVEIRKLILGIYNELPNNTSWRFVDKSFSFPNVNNPFQTQSPETITEIAAITNQLGEDFVGVKVGDVNGSVVANATMQSEERTAGTAIFDLEDREVKSGEVFELTFKAAQHLQGFQFTMLHSGLELLDVVQNEGVNAQNFGQFEGKTTVSVDGAQAFTLQFRATKSGKLSEMLGVSGAITRAEAYLPPVASAKDGQVQRLGIAFRFDGQTMSGVGFELYQNQPNPFMNKTFIGFYLPEATEATLSVFDEAGRVVYQQKGKFAKGENSVSLERALINTTGMLFYKLETATDSATKKMIQTK
jgi:hypothetical protein